jgi:hypothetical protein
VFLYVAGSAMERSARPQKDLTSLIDRVNPAR